LLSIAIREGRPLDLRSTPFLVYWLHLLGALCSGSFIFFLVRLRLKLIYEAHHVLVSLLTSGSRSFPRSLRVRPRHLQGRSQRQVRQIFPCSLPPLSRSLASPHNVANSRVMLLFIQETRLRLPVPSLLPFRPLHRLACFPAGSSSRPLASNHQVRCCDG
jgi:hypothetical protein